MSTTVPSAFFPLVGSGGQEIATARPILADFSADAGVAKLVQNSTWNYANANRRIVFAYGTTGHVDDTIVVTTPLTTTDATVPPAEIVFETSVTLSANTDKITFVARAENMTIDIQIFGADDKTGSIDTLTDTTGADAVANLTDTSVTLAGDETITLEIRCNRLSVSTGKLYGMYIYEQWLVEADLPT